MSWCMAVEPAPKDRRDFHHEATMRLTFISLLMLACSFPAFAEDTVSQDFRSLLSATLTEADPAADVNRVLYGSHETLGSEPHDPALSASDNLNRIADSWKGMAPSALFTLGSGVVTRAPDMDLLNSSLRQRPVLLVLVPGFLSEFAGAPIFADVLNQQSAFAGVWRSKLNAHSDRDDTRDVYYSLKHNGYFNDSLNAVINAGSIDQAGAPLVRMISFTFPAMQTLESIGRIEDTARIYARRLQKAVNILGADAADIVLVGHSRGAAVALAMAALGKKGNHEWTGRLRGVFSLAGLMTGSRGADNQLIQGTSERATYLASNELRNSLKIGSNLNPFVLLANLRAFKRYKSATDRNNAHTTSRLNALFGNSPMHDSKYSGVDSLMDQLGEHLNQRDGGGKAHKLKIFIGEINKGMQDMQTASRLTWWQNNNLPVAGVKYYSLAATFTDQRRSAEELDLTRNIPGMAQGSLDFGTALKGYRSFLISPLTRTVSYETAQTLNDGVLASWSSVMWPKLISSLNPQNTITTEHLGILGTPHASVAHPVANEGSSVNRFPRAALLKAIAIKATLDLN